MDVEKSPFELIDRSSNSPKMNQSTSSSIQLLNSSGRTTIFGDEDKSEITFNLPDEGIKDVDEEDSLGLNTNNKSYNDVKALIAHASSSVLDTLTESHEIIPHDHKVSVFVDEIIQNAKNKLLPTDDDYTISLNDGPTFTTEYSDDSSSDTEIDSDDDSINKNNQIFTSILNPILE